MELTCELSLMQTACEMEEIKEEAVTKLFADHQFQHCPEHEGLKVFKYLLMKVHLVLIV